jgi:hypothetical protein
LRFPAVGRLAASANAFTTVIERSGSTLSMAAQFVDAVIEQAR